MRRGRRGTAQGPAADDFEMLARKALCRLLHEQRRHCEVQFLYQPARPDVLAIAVLNPIGDGRGGRQHGKLFIVLLPTQRAALGRRVA
ncbi:hypothetical protein G6F68_019174 [Rhizopus microsporus]|nr:hypothetical protein G6F68_019174 [Rhizopus microsporus]